MADDPFSGFDADASRPPLKLLLYDDIQINTEVIDFVEDVLVEGSAAVIYGESNSGKTFFALDLALHVATGRAWRGKTVAQGGVVYLALEGSLGFSNRVAAWRQEVGEDTPATFAAITTAVDLLHPDADVDVVTQAIYGAAAIFGMPIRLVVVDTLSRAMAGGNENAPDDMGALVQSQDRIRAATGAAVLWIHHSGKDAAKGARGHSLLRAAVDTEIEVTADGPARCARVAKQRELEGGQDFDFTLSVVELGTNGRGKPVTSCVVDHGTAGATPITRRARLKGHTRRAFELLVDLVAASGVGGFRGAPASVSSVPEDWWRERFYEAAIPGAAQEAKRRAFTRAASLLVETHTVGMAHGRVWLPPNGHHARRTDDAADE